MPFPLSAFGEYATVTNEDGSSFDKPKEINRLHSFGLEDPFVWAIYRCQELDAEREDAEDAQTLESVSEEAKYLESTGRYYGFLFLFNTGKWVAKAKQLRDRLKKPVAVRSSCCQELQKRRDERLPQAEPLYTTLRNILIMQGVTLVIIVSIVLLTGVFMWDWHASANFKAVLDNPKSKLELRFEKANEYLRTCIGVFCTQYADALAVQQEYKQSIDGAKWKQAKLINTEDAINAYLKEYPQGNHADEARAVLGQLMKTKDWKAFRDRYDEYISNGDVLEAARLLEKLPRYKDSTELTVRANFPEQAKNLLAIKLDEWIERKEWMEAKKGIQQINQIPADVWPIEPRMQTSNELSKKLNLAWDRTLYEDAVNFRNRDKMTDYVSQAPLGTMKAEVEGYLEYLNKRATDNNFQLMLTRVQWSDNAPSKGGVTFRMTVQNNEVTSPLLTGTLYEKDANVNLLATFKAKYNHTIKVKIWAEGTGFFGTKTLGETEMVNLTIQDTITYGAELKLRNDTDETGTAFLKLTDTATEPSLPAWRAP